MCCVYHYHKKKKKEKKQSCCKQKDEKKKTSIFLPLSLKPSYFVQFLYISVLVHGRYLMPYISKLHSQ